eukprot:CAMPEP_0174999988 /NCGR_PEP_ID=MMETSP0005-20121125/2345_1 /TAXON_ID=420556 /ORGANISM="Ochromonas sp., Strain CCMP1393" /LENGTH=108 /DNA_ID=CAMNT_0016254747 /DNA_START=1244 /DNA_END=1571 /DNA_ORIENTATION=-
MHDALGEGSSGVTILLLRINMRRRGSLAYLFPAGSIAADSADHSVNIRTTVVAGDEGDDLDNDVDGDRDSLDQFQLPRLQTATVVAGAGAGGDEPELIQDKSVVGSAD